MSKLDKVYNNSLKIYFDETSKIILMSDCHRGDGSFRDNFKKNKNIYFESLNYYYKDGYTYIEIGDGDELWENKNMKEIIKQYFNIFSLLSKFNEKKRLYLIYGNHDKVKKTKKVYKKYLCNNLKDINFYEGITLINKNNNDELFLLHGHQGDLLNDNLWIISKFFVRYILKPFDLLIRNNPTNRSIECTEKRLLNWSKIHNKIVIIGHTHNPEFPRLKTNLYFNVGSCINANEVTGIEIKNNELSLIKWSNRTKEDNSVYIDKDILIGPRKINDYYVLANKNKTR